MWCNDAMRNASSADTPSEFYLSKRRSATQRLEALKLCQEIGVMKASRKTGVPFSTLYKWRMWAKKHPLSIMGKQSMNKETHDGIEQAEVSNQTETNMSASHPSDGLTQVPARGG